MNANGEFVLSNFKATEPDITSVPAILKDGQYVAPAGTWVTYDGDKIGRITVTKFYVSDIPNGEAPVKLPYCYQYAKLNIFVPFADVEHEHVDLLPLTANTCKNMHHVVQTLSAKWVPVDAIERVVFVFLYRDLERYNYLAQGRIVASALRYRKSADEVEEIGEGECKAFASLYKDYNGDDAPRRYWQGIDTLANISATHLRRKDPEQAGVSGADAVSPLVPFSRDVFAYIKGLFELFDEDKRPVEDKGNKVMLCGQGVVTHALKYDVRAVKKEVTKIRFEGASLEAYRGIIGENALVGRQKRLPRKNPANVTDDDRRSYLLHATERVSYVRDGGEDEDGGSITWEFHNEDGQSRIKVRTRHLCGKADQVEESKIFVQQNRSNQQNQQLAETRCAAAAAAGTSIATSAATGQVEVGKVKKGRSFVSSGKIYRVKSISGRSVTATCIATNEDEVFHMDEVPDMMREYYAKKMKH